MATAPRLKYRNIPTVVNGLKFSSRAEARRYGELRLLQHAGVIADLTVQPRFPIVIDGVKVCTYIADFSYRENGNLKVEDVKSKPTRTQAYIIKVKLMKVILHIDVEEVFVHGR